MANDIRGGGTVAFDGKPHEQYQYFQMKWYVLQKVEQDDTVFLICRLMDDEKHYAVFMSSADDMAVWTQIEDQEQAERLKKLAGY